MKLRQKDKEFKPSLQNIVWVYTLLIFKKNKRILWENKTVGKCAAVLNLLSQGRGPAFVNTTSTGC